MVRSANIVVYSPFFDIHQEAFMHQEAQYQSPVDMSKIWMSQSREDTMISSPACQQAIITGHGACLRLPHFRTSISICVLYGPISVGLRTRASCQRHRLKSLQDAKPLTLSSTSRPPDCWAFLRSFEDLEGTPHIHSLKILRGK